jgi:hypothetical protein
MTGRACSSFEPHCSRVEPDLPPPRSLVTACGGIRTRRTLGIMDGDAHKLGSERSVNMLGIRENGVPR